MTDKHKIASGDHIFRLAHVAGFRTPRPVELDAANSGLRRERGNLATLVPGDIVVVPTLEPRETTGTTNTFNVFTVAASGVFLNLILQDTERRPLKGRAFRLVDADTNLAGGQPKVGAPAEGVTTDTGEVSVEVLPFAIEAELTVHETDDLASPIAGRIKILVAVLESANTIRGQQARLNNMGYFAGFSDQHLEQLQWAIEEFQFDHGLKPSGRFDDPVTFNRIAHEHGDLPRDVNVP